MFFKLFTNKRLKTKTKNSNKVKLDTKINSKRCYFFLHE